jgi:hypothetical protein
MVKMMYNFIDSQVKDVPQLSRLADQLIALIQKKVRSPILDKDFTGIDGGLDADTAQIVQLQTEPPRPPPPVITVSLSLSLSLSLALALCLSGCSVVLYLLSYVRRFSA